ncbi:MAG: type VI secretion system tip protein VgrG [Gemmataceae bacterium]|nr:type VI secretion system tip protein VgrG [Gemmataceae bacterium]
MAILQQDRLVFLSTPLGKDVLLVETLEGTESISNLFRFNLVLVSEKRDIPLNGLVGQNVTVAIELPGKQFRHINGFVSRFSQGDVDARTSHYYAEVVPWLWFLTRTSDCRIFQKKSVPDIIQQIFKDLGFSDFKLKLQGSFEPREFCVQYRETDFDFISRLAQEEGIFYFFVHADGKHTMILSNDPGVHAPCPNQTKARYGYLTGGVQHEDMVTRWHLEQELQPGKYTHTDYYFQTPSNSLLVSAPSAVKVGGNDKFEVYDYPGAYAKRFDGEAKAGKVRPDGERTAKLRMQGDEAFHKVVNGAGTCRAFTPGYKFELTEHRRADLNGPYVLTSVSHSATNDLGGGEGATYDSTFTCIPLAVPFRPARTTPRPIVHGTQTAVVVGLGGEEIDTDKYGRVKVQFHWDREGKKNQDSSCWVRVATPWAGKQWGMIHIPRIGQEVIVDFLEGDPDQPIIIGSVYNAELMPPYNLPDKKTQSGVKSRSSLKGSPDNFNEIRFEDLKGNEQILIHAEKNQDIEVENDESHWVGHNRVKTIDNDETTQVKHDRTATVDNNETITVHGSRTEKVDKDETVSVGGNRSQTVTKDESLSVSGKRTATVSKDDALTVEGSRSANITKSDALSVQKDLTATVGGSMAVQVTKSFNQSVKDSIVIESQKDILIKCGEASILLKKDGKVEISGSKLDIKMSGNITNKGSKIALN